MAKIAAAEEQTFQVPTNSAHVYAFFTQPERLRGAMTGVDRCEALPQERVRWVLEEKVGKGIRFQPDYVVAYERNGVDHVRCRTIEGNMRNDWDAWFKPSHGGTEIRYRETVEVDLPITALLACLIKPLVVKELRNDVQRFLDRVREDLAN